MSIFAFTDIEGSTGLWERHQGAMGAVIARHYAILDELTPRWGGKIIKKTGDGIFALFPDEAPGEPSRALAWAVDCQRRFQGQVWPVVGELRVRMALHRGEAEEMDGDFYGPTANRTARLMSLGWGGQILVSEDLRRVAVLPEGAAWADLGAHQVKDLPEPVQIFALLHPDLPLREFPPLKSLSNRPHNFPQELSPFVGRERELRELERRLTQPQSRLLCLLGPPGVGKSRLAARFALEHLGTFKHGAFRVELGSGKALAEAVAAALKLSLYGGQPAQTQVLDFLKERQMLLVLDPAEGLATQAATLRAWLEAGPGLRVLVCARRRLGLPGETVLKLGGLELPGPQGDVLAVNPCAQLFLHEARAVLPGFAYAADDGPALARLCRVLRGLPLGLELAAEALRTTPLKALAERVEKEPRFLVSERPDRPPAQRSLQAQFDAVWEGLNEAERRALAGLAVFSAPFSVPAAKGVLQLGDAALAGLVDAGLLENAGGGRFALSEITRLFAALRLDGDAVARENALDQHARYYLRLWQERERALSGYGQVKALTELRAEYPNLPRAWERALARGWRAELASAARAVALYASMQGLAREWESRLERALELWEKTPGLAPSEAQSAFAALLAGLGDLAFALGRSAAARERMERSLSFCRRVGHKAGTAYALVRLAVLLGPEDERRLPLLEEAVQLYQGLNDSNGAAWARRHLGFILCLQGRSAEGRPCLEQALAVFTKVGNAREVAWCHNAMGQAELEPGGDPARGLAELKEARRLFLELGDLETAAWTLNRLGRAALQQGRYDEAAAAFEEALSLFGRLRHLRGRALALRSLCEAHAAKGDREAAVRTVERAVAEALAHGDVAGQAAALLQKAQLQAPLDAEAALATLQTARACFAQAGSESGAALALEARAGVLCQKGDRRGARAALEEALECHVQKGQREAEARLCVRLGDLDQAEGRPQGGEPWYQRALRHSRQQKPGDYSLGALLGLAALQLKQGRKLEALHLALVCERALAQRLFPPSEPEFYGELEQRCRALLDRLGGKLLASVIEEARVRLSKQDARALLKDSLNRTQL